MRDREAMQLRGFTALHNGFLSVLSLIMFCGQLYETVQAAGALAAAFTARNALQCGFCTPGMIASAVGYIEGGGTADRDAVRAHISGNYCRCTGYQSIVDAICDVIGGDAP